MLKLYHFDNSVLNKASDIELIASIIKKDRNSINIFSSFNNINDALLKVAGIAQSGLKEYEMQLEMIENFHIALCEELKIDFSTIFSYFQNIKKTIAATFEIKDLSPKTIDKILGNSSLLTAKILYEYLKNNALEADFIDLTADVDYKKIKPNSLYIVGGFDATQHNISAIAKNLNLKTITVFKDFDGIFTADPEIVKDALHIDRISYQEVAELSHFSNKIVDFKALQTARINKITINVKSTYRLEGPGTVIAEETNKNLKIKGINKIDEISLIALNGFNIPGVSGFSGRVFKALHQKNISVVFISQSSSEVSICFAVKNPDAKKAREAIESEFRNEIAENLMYLESKEKQSIIAVSGSGMANIPGISGKIFSNLGKSNINVNAIAQGISEANISFAVNSDMANLAIKLIHNSIFENKQVNCLIAGNGVVGSSVIKMIKSQRDYFKDHGIDLNIIGGFTSKKYFINGDFSDVGLDYKNFDEVIAQFRKQADIHYVLIDCTSSDLLVENYQKFIESGFNIVTPNKKANSLDLKKFENLQEVLKENKKHFFYEANVGAGLPVISTIKDLIDCGDDIIKIEGIFSGTLSYIFNNLNGEKKFSEIVLEAKEKGFTEPDPREDLCGIDVGRKLLILARIIGRKINLENIEIQSLVDLSDEEVAEMVSAAKKNNQVLRYVGMIEKDKIYSKIIAVGAENPLASTQHSDNIIALTTKFYNKTPLAIRGPGAGADVTAIGVVSDLIKLAKLL